MENRIEINKLCKSYAGIIQAPNRQYRLPAFCTYIFDVFVQKTH